MFPDPLNQVSVLVRVSNEGRLRYQGTCFPLLPPSWWATAGHCLDHDPGGDLGLVAPQATPPVLDKVRDAVRHPHLDLALLRSERELGVAPLGTHGTVAPGADISVIGYPEDLFLDEGGRDRPRLRFLKGHVQRIEPVEEEADGRGDLELSFACPGGLSGSPVLIQGSNDLVGIVIGNRDSYVITDTTEASTSTAGQSHTVETRRVVSFGAALSLARARDWIEGTIDTLGPSGA